MKQKQQKKEKVEVNIRKKEQEELSKKPADPKQKALDRLKDFDAKKDEEQIDINEEEIFKHALAVANANDKVGMNAQLPERSPAENKKTSFEAPSRLMDPEPKRKRDLYMFKAKSEVAQPPSAKKTQSDEANAVSKALKEPVEEEKKTHKPFGFGRKKEETKEGK